jgi:nitrite reductase/ring-hydroxylating ferredoxin subunit
METRVQDSWIALCPRAALAADRPTPVRRDGVAYAVFLLDGTPYVTHDICTHGPGLLSEGDIEGEEVICPFHQGRFHIPSGRPTGAPCTEPVRVFPALVIDGTVCIRAEP